MFKVIGLCLLFLTLNALAQSYPQHTDGFNDQMWEERKAQKQAELQKEQNAAIEREVRLAIIENQMKAMDKQIASADKKGKSGDLEYAKLVKARALLVKDKEALVKAKLAYYQKKLKETNADLADYPTPEGDVQLEGCTMEPSQQTISCPHLGKDYIATPAIDNTAVNLLNKQDKSEPKKPKYIYKGPSSKQE